jgi:hypothetical protein
MLLESLIKRGVSESFKQSLLKICWGTERWRFNNNFYPIIVTKFKVLIMILYSKPLLKSVICEIKIVANFYFYFLLNSDGCLLMIVTKSLFLFCIFYLITVLRFSLVDNKLSVCNHYFFSSFSMLVVQDW